MQISFWQNIQHITAWLTWDKVIDQGIVIVAALIAAFVTNRFIRHFVMPLTAGWLVEQDRSSKMLHWLGQTIFSLLSPLLTLTALLIGARISHQLTGEAILVRLVIAFAVVWFLARLVYQQTKGNRDITILATIAFIIVSILSALGLWHSTMAYLDAQALQFGETRVSIYSAFKAVLTIYVLFLITNYTRLQKTRYINSIKGIKVHTKLLVTKFTDILLYFVALMVGLNILGVDLTALAVFSGAIGVGLGFGLQKITSNFISGMILLFERSIEVGDLVELDGISGNIKQLGARYTLIETFNGREVMVPNEDFVTNRVTNWTFSSENARVDIAVGVAYGTDLEKAQAICIDAAQSHPRCSTKKEPACFVTEFGDSAINLQLMFWVDDVQEGRLGPKSDVMVAIDKAFKQEKIEIPFPQRVVHQAK